MKKLLLTYVIAAICIGLCSTVMAGPTVSSQSESQGAVTIADDSKDSDFFLLDWLYWFLDDVLGWDQRGGHRYYNSGNGGSGSGTDSGDVDWGSGSGDGDWGSGSGDGDSGSDPGDSGSGSDPGDSDWGYDPGSGDWGSDPGDSDWGSDPGDSDWGYDDTNSNPVQSIPAPSALVLGGIGSGIISWLRRRRTL